MRSYIFHSVHEALIQIALFFCLNFVMEKLHKEPNNLFALCYL